MDGVTEVKSRVLSRLATDFSACDCLVTLFHSALSGYRHDTVLKPFPSNFIMDDGTKDIDGLRATFDALSPLDQVKDNIHSLSDNLLHLLDWILFNKNFTLQSKPANEFLDIENKTVGSTHTSKPYAVFQLEYSPEQETRWQEVCKGQGSFLAYHGSRVENFHCISHIGLISHMNKTGLYGEGTYLSTDLGVCMNFSPSANVWSHSRLPSLCSMVGVCEVVDNPEIRSRTQVGGEPNFDQKIPERYFVVTNDELLRLKYILVFAQQTVKPRGITRHHWLYRHKWNLIIALYIAFLLIIGLYNSRYVKTLYKQYTRKHLTL